MSNKKEKKWITDWWPKRLNLKPLRQNAPNSTPYGPDFNYAKEFESLNISELKKDLKELMTKSQDWWPADFGHYGPLFIRMAWHSAGSYRIYDGRGGARTGDMRFAPRIDWPDNMNLDKAIRLLWPIKQKYGKKISWADLIILAGNVAFESMGFKTLGFGGGREDTWEPDEGVDWGPEQEMVAGSKERYKEGELERPFAATEMGLIYVNPAGPDGNPDPIGSAKQIRTAFRRMGMNDEETVALIAGGHSFGKCHGACPESHVGPDPDSSPVEQQGLGWKSNYKSGKGPDTFTSGFELAWTPTPTQFSMSYFQLLFAYEWELTKSPAGKPQWVAKEAPPIIPDAFDSNKKHPPMMLTADLALRYDPEYAKIAKRFLENPGEFEKAFTKAWFKLTHRDMGPIECYYGSEVPKEVFLWQEPLSKRDFEIIDESDVKILKEKILLSGIDISKLVYTAWSSASTYRDSDRKGGANGARIRLKPFSEWEINHPDDLKQIISVYEKIQQEFNNSQKNGKRVSIADLIVLGGCVGIEESVKKAGLDLTVPFTPGRLDALQEQIDIVFWSEIQPIADGFRNYIKDNLKQKAEYYLVDKAQLLRLTVPEMVALYGGLRVLGINYKYTNYGVFAENPATLTNDFFVNLLDMGIEWKPIDSDSYLFNGYDRKTGLVKWTATRVDLIFGHHSELRAVCETYGANDGKEIFIHDFIKVWDKCMNLDRFDMKK